MNTNKIEELESIARERILILDGAMGTIIQKEGLNEEDFRGEYFKDAKSELKGLNDVLAITRPDIIASIHKQYIDAGADIIETDSFNSNAVSLSTYGLQKKSKELNIAAAKLARQEADKCLTRKVFVAGSIGPTDRTLSMSPDIADPAYRNLFFDELYDAYLEQIEALIEGGVDLLIFETIFDPLNAKAGLLAAEHCFKKLKLRLPVFVSASINDNSGRILTGQTIESLFIAVRHASPMAIGLNCGRGAREYFSPLDELNRLSDTLTLFYPNAGLPDEMGKYSQDPEYMASIVKEFAEKGMVNITGGCCGSTPEHIAAIKKAVKGIKPRKTLNEFKGGAFCGFDPLFVNDDTNFINIGERTNVAGSAKFARLIQEENYAEALSVAAQQIENGAQIIDVNVDDPLIDAEKVMAEFLKSAVGDPAIGHVPVMIDSSTWSVIVSGLKVTPGKSIVNSLSLKDGEESFREKAEYLKEFGAAVLIMAFDEKGQADTLERRVEICERAYKILVNEIGFFPKDIIFDPNVFAIATGMPEHNKYALEYIESIKEIKKRCPGALFSGGISNLSFSFRGNNKVREALHTVFLYHAIQAGLNMGIVNAGFSDTIESLPKDLKKVCEDLILDRDPDASAKLLEMAQEIFKDKDKVEEKAELWRESSLEDRLKYSIIKGLETYVNEDIQEAIGAYSSAVDIIEGPLMDGMNEVGILFGEGKMFLPQVIKTARVMKAAVAILTPLINAEGKGGAAIKKPKIVLATVRGDVHDIGKKIVGSVLECNGFEIVDLGVMVPGEDIINAVIKEDADMLGLSGLITPSLAEMASVAQLMEKAGLKIPLLVGGAATSRRHTALKIANEYSGPVIQIRDASVSASFCKKLSSATEKEVLIKEINDEYEDFRNAGNSGKKVIDQHSLVEARALRFQSNLKNEPVVKPKVLGTKVLLNIEIEELLNFIDWNPFFRIWGLKGKYPEILKDDIEGVEATKIYNKAMKLLEKIKLDKSVKPSAVVKMFRAESVNESVNLFSLEDNSKVGELSFLRQQKKKKDTPNYCLADFISSKESGQEDYIGLFAVTAGDGIMDTNDSMDEILFKAVSDRLAEATAEYLHYNVRVDYWGFDAEEMLSFKELIKEQYKGIRPAPGYPSYPDHTEKKLIVELLEAEKNIGMTLTENFMMIPESSVCGVIIANPDACYFPLGYIGKDQKQEYAKSKGLSMDDMDKFISVQFE